MLPHRDNETIWWEGVQRHSPPKDPNTLRRGMLFLDPDSRAIEYMRLLDTIPIRRNMSPDNGRPWKQDSVLTRANQFDMGGAAGIHTFPV